MNIRVGHGYDVHRLVKGRPLIIGGLKLDYELGLSGHSDADVLLHAICDALLGAAALGDIGKHFPDTDESYRDADSRMLLAETVKLIGNSGYRIVNIDSTVIAEKPKLSGRIDEMRKNIAETCKTDISSVSVKATTEEKLGFTGEGKGIAAHAVVLIEKITEDGGETHA